MDDKKMNECKTIIIDLEGVEKEYGVETKEAVFMLIDYLFDQAREAGRSGFSSLFQFKSALNKYKNEKQ